MYLSAPLTANFREYDKKKAQEEIAVNRYLHKLEHENFFTPDGALVWFDAHRCQFLKILSAEVPPLLIGKQGMDETTFDWLKEEWNEENPSKQVSNMVLSWNLLTTYGYVWEF